LLSSQIQKVLELQDKKLLQKPLSKPEQNKIQMLNPDSIPNQSVSPTVPEALRRYDKSTKTNTFPEIKEKIGVIQVKISTTSREIETLTNKLNIENSAPAKEKINLQIKKLQNDLQLLVEEQQQNHLRFSDLVKENPEGGFFLFFFFSKFINSISP
jgi:hypothetical protein